MPVSFTICAGHQRKCVLPFPLSLFPFPYFVALIILLAFFAPVCRSQEAATDEVVVVGAGMAALTDDSAGSEEEAVWDAKRNAVEQAAGFFLKARAIGRDFQLESDRIEARTDGFVRKWEIVPGSRRIETVGNGKILRLQVRATVALLPVIKKLQDIRDVYDDLERPRIRVTLIGDSANGAAKRAILAALQAQGFETATGDSAEITLSARVDAEPLIKLGDKEAAYGVGESVAACRAVVTLEIVSEVSEQTLFIAKSEGAGSSFQSDADARSEAIESAAQTLIEQEDGIVLRRLLIRWARERQEGHAVAVEITNLDSKRIALLRDRLREMRGYVRSLGDTETPHKTTFRFLTRLESRAIRRRLAALRLDNLGLRVLNERGPHIVCAAASRPRSNNAAALDFVLNSDYTD